MQVKETGTPVDFANAREIKLQKYTYQDDVFGIYAYQSEPVTIDATTRDIFANGSLADLQNQATGQGMPTQYIKISWNETQQGNNYYITDLVVGVVSKVTRNFNTGPAYLIDALKAVSWFKQFIAKVGMPWKAWLLLISTRNTAYNNWGSESVSDWKSVAKPVTESLPDLPTSEETLAILRQEGKFDDALGQFAVQMLDKGYTVTLLGYNLSVCFEKTPTIRLPFIWGYRYKLHVRFTWDFTSNPDVSVEQSNRLFIWTIPIILAIVAAVTFFAVAVIVSYNLTHEESSYVKYDVLRDSNGNPIYDSNGNPIIVPTEKGNSSGPPDWWSGVIQNVVIAGLVIGGIILAVVVVPKLLPKRKEKER